MPSLECTFETCDRPRRRHGLCDAHSQQLKRRGLLAPLRPKRAQGAASERDADGRKLCTTCDTWKEESAFQKHDRASDGLSVRCTLCRARALRARVHGVTVSALDDLLAAQGNVCAICGADSPGTQGWAVDHDHTCCSGYQGCGKCIRGILCNPCNLAIGLMRDNPAFLRAAAGYIESGSVSA